MKREIRLPETVEGRLDRALADLLGAGRAAIKTAFAAGEVRVSGRRARASDSASPGALVVLELPERPGPPLPDDDLRLSVLAVGEGWLAADKPAGVATHPLRAEEGGTLANAVAARYPECAEASPDPRDGGALQRLDMDTSGCVLFARSREAWSALRAQLTARTLEKRYLALAAGRVASGGVLSVPLAQRAGRVVAVPDPDRPPKSTGKPREAETRYEVLRTFEAYTLLDVQIITGVTHQIRAHLAYLGHPVAGDLTYGGPELEGLDRHFLHAAALGFERPEGGRARVESPLPAALREVLERLP